MLDAILADFRAEFQEARKFIELIKKFQGLATTVNARKFNQACKAKDYDAAKRLYVQASRTAGL